MPAAILEAVVGSQRPRIEHVPEGRRSARGREAVEVARLAGLNLDEWQERVLVEACRTRPGGRWAAFQVGVNVPRQNGKGGITEARELAGLFAFGEPFVIHSAHMFDTSLEAFRRLLVLIEDTPDFDREVKRVVRSHGEEGIELKSGQRIRYRTRSKGGGRGFTSGLLVFDEAMILAMAAHGALVPTLAAVADKQIWYTGSAVDKELHEHGLVFSRIRERAIAGGPSARRLAYFEWSAPFESPADVPAEALGDVEVWRQANPAFGIRIDEDAVEGELDALDGRSFAVERLGVGDYPDTSGTGSSRIDLEAVAELVDERSEALDPVVLAFDVSPDRQGTIVAAGRRADRLLHGEEIESRPGTKWIAPRLVELVDEHEVEAIVVDAYGPAANVVAQALDLGVQLEVLDATGHAEACSAFEDLTRERAYRGRSVGGVLAALRGAKSKELGDRWAWSRKASTGNVAPLVAFTFAVARARLLPDDDEVGIW